MRHHFLSVIILTSLILVFSIVTTSVDAAGEGKIYYSVGSSAGIDQIYSANLDGSSPTLLYDYPENSSGFAPIIDGLDVDTTNGYIYIAVEQKGDSFNINSIDRINIDGSGFVQLTTTQFPLDVAYSPSDNKVYWLEQSSPVRMRRMNPNGTGVEDVRTLTNQALREIEIDPIQGYVYWSDGADSSAGFAGRIRRAPLGVGTPVEIIYDNQGTNRLTGLAIDRGSCSIFWAFQDNGIRSGNLDGSTVTPPTLVNGANTGGNVRPLAIYHPTGEMFWTDLTGDGAVRKANINGTGVTTIISGTPSIEVDRDLTVGNPPFASLTVPTTNIDTGDAGAGSAGNAVQFTVTGTNIQPNNGVVTITAPTNFEVSTNGTTFGATATLTASGGNINGANNVWIRTTSTAPTGAVNGTITYSGGGTGNSTCSDTTPVSGNIINNTAPTITTNTGLAIVEGSTGNTIAQANLEISDNEQSTANLTYTLDSVPGNGTLKLNGNPLAANDTFTQANINAGNLTYDHGGGTNTSDSFQFDISDGFSSINNTTFNITVYPLVTIGIDTTLSEGNSGTTNFNFTVDLSTPANGDTTITYSVTNGTTDAADFGAIGSQITIPNSQSSGVITIPVTGDFSIELDETFTVTLTGITTSNAGLGTTTTVNGTINNDDMAGINIGAFSNPLDEATPGTTSDYTYQPTTAISGNVVLDLTTDGQCTVTPNQITITPNGSNIPAAVTVTATVVNDSIIEGAHSCIVSAVVNAGLTTDTNYDPVVVGDATVNIADDDIAGILVNPTTGLLTSETLGSDTFTVVLTAKPTADVTIDLSSDDITEGNVSPTSLTFSDTNWDTPQTVTVTGVNDNIADGNVSYSVVTAPANSADGNYLGVNPDDVSVTNTDDDMPSITVNPTSGLQTTEQGGTASFTIVLNTQPTDSVTIDLSSSDISEGIVSPASLTFSDTNWNTPQTVTVTGVNDDNADGNVSYFIVTAPANSADGNYLGVNPDDVSVTNTDDDMPSITVNPTSGLQTTEQGGTASFTIVLDTQPTDSVTIGLSSSDNSEGIVNPSNVVFTASNWNIPQTIMVTGVDDADTDGNIGYVIITSVAVSNDLSFNGIDPSDVAITNLDDNDSVPPGPEGACSLPNPPEPSENGAPHAPLNLCVEPLQGQPRIVWSDDVNAQWFNLFIIGSNGTIPVYDAWFSKPGALFATSETNIVECDTIFCEMILPERYALVGGGTFTVWIRAWGTPDATLENGSYSQGGTGQYAGFVYDQFNTVTFSIPTGRPQPASNVALTGTTEANSTFTWQAPDGVIWYQLAVVTEPSSGVGQYVTYHFMDWTFAEQLGCLEGGTCIYTLPTTLPAGQTYTLWMNSWGPGGFNLGSLGLDQGWIRQLEFVIN